MIAADRLGQLFVEVADSLTDDFDLIEFLQMLTARSSDLLRVDAAGVLFADPSGRLQLMAASDERTQMLELFQLQSREGPCLECFREGRAVVGADLRLSTDRWPQFAPRAVQLGFHAVHAFPLRLRQHVIGALNLFSSAAGAIDPADARVVQALADVATIALLQERAIRRGEVLTEQLQGALNSRIAIEQAKGALAQVHGCSIDDAFDLLKLYTRRTGRPLTEVARDVTRDPDRVAELLTASDG
ncbi:GAF and ANTAR domain-containing protein [Nocardioides sp. MAHUQ-72]|uniref:GAF and ANTAR domain-containing protein n=1 Tax=unclassified Nocardioides TaxID=2615069 RepID=UPI00361691F4